MNSLVHKDFEIKNIGMVVFDKDGTIIDVHYYWKSMVEYRAKFLLKSTNRENDQELYDKLVDVMGVDLLTGKIKTLGPVGVKPRKYIVDQVNQVMNGFDKSYTKKMVEEVFESVDSYTKTKLDEIVQILPGVKLFLDALKVANIKMAIATTDLSERAELALKTLKIESYFEVIAGSDLVRSPKPASDLVEFIVNKSNLPKENIVVIGDSMSDLNMAKNANCTFLGVRTGLYTKDFISECNYLITTLDEIKVQV